MNTLIFFLAGVSIGLVTDKLYHSLGKTRKPTEKSDKDEGVDTTKEKMPEAKEEVVGEQAVEIKQQEPTRTADTSSETEERHDDLSQLKGVGPKLAESLQKIGIRNYQQLASSSVDSLLEQLKQTGGRFSRATISSIVERSQDQLKVNEI